MGPQLKAGTENASLRRQATRRSVSGTYRSPCAKPWTRITCITPQCGLPYLRANKRGFGLEQSASRNTLGCATRTKAVSAADVAGKQGQGEKDDPNEEAAEPWLDRVSDAWERFCALPEVKTAVQVGQFAASLLFVVLYVWSTYSVPQPFSWRSNLDLFLCAAFAADYFIRFGEAESKIRMVVGFWNVLDLLAFFPPLLEACLLHGANVPFKLGRFDLRWFKILRALRVTRVSLLAGELKTMHLSSSGALLSGAASVRLFQLIASVLTLLFTTSSIIVLVERIPFHLALYFVTTTLTTVGFGDVVMSSVLGKAVVLGMICVGVVLIPVQTSQLYSQLTARRVTLGTVPDKRIPSILVSTRLTEVRGFSDFFSEFFQALKKSRLPQKLHMMVLCNRPNFEFRAFQELNDKRLTLMEGSALSERDLVRAKAESSTACLLLADRFSPKPEEEDLNLQFQVWALKSYTKRVPLYVQVLQKSSINLISPFLDPEQDVLVSTEQTRHRLLALSCLCPGASTLISNLLRRAAVLPREGQRRTAGGRRWLRNYLNGCAFKVFDSKLSTSLARVPFAEAAEWLYRTSGFVLMGVVRDKQVILNPGRRRLKGGEVAIVIGTSQQAIDSALAEEFTAAPPLKGSLTPKPSVLESHDGLTASDSYSDARPVELASKVRKAASSAASSVLTTGKKPVQQAADWLSTLKDVAESSKQGLKPNHRQADKTPMEIQAARNEYFYPEDEMPCVLDSPYCKYDRYDDADEASDKERRASHAQASTSDAELQPHVKFVEGYPPVAMEEWAYPEASESFDEEDDPDARRQLANLGSSLRVTLTEFYNNLGDITAPKRPQPGFEQPRADERNSSDGGGGTESHAGGEHSGGREGDLGTNGSDAELDDEDVVDKAHEASAHLLEDSWKLDSKEIQLEDPDEYKVPDSAAAVHDSADVRASQDEAAIELPELTTESYEDDPEDPNTLSVEEILGAYKHRHDNLHQELEDDDLEVTVTDYVAHASLERRRPPTEEAPSKWNQAPQESDKSDTERLMDMGGGRLWTFDNQERNYEIEEASDVDVWLPMSEGQDGSDDDNESAKTSRLTSHIIICGAVESFVSFVQQVRQCDPISTPIVILHHQLPKAIWPNLKALGPMHFVQGNPSDAASLQKASASRARALVFLAHAHRPYRAEDVPEGEGYESSFASRTAVLADAQGLLTCYGVGEDGSANLPHAVVELCFTSSVRFLQPGLLLKGQGFMDESPHVTQEALGQPRKSWQMRRRQERAAIKEGLAEWQANPYYCAGRVTVPALMDTFACQCFFNQGMLTDLMEELAGDDGRAGGAQLRQLPLPEGMAGRTYGELFASMALTRKLLPLGLYRRKSENPAWRLYYVVTNPPPEERLDVGDRVFVLRERGGPWLTALPPG